jgi:hypothetical protein
MADPTDSESLRGLRTAQLARFPWVLLLHANERVTPLLAIDVQECLAEPASHDAYRIPVDRFLFGNCASLVGSKNSPPVRLFHQRRCSFSIVGGGLAISANPERTGELGGSIQQRLYPDITEYLDAANVRSTRAAAERFGRGERTRLGRSMLRSVLHFFSSYARSGGYQHGWDGFQSSVLSAFDIWLQDVKLWQLTHQFCSSPLHTVEVGSELDDAPVVAHTLTDAALLARGKAA